MNALLNEQLYFQAAAKVRSIAEDITSSIYKRKLHLHMLQEQIQTLQILLTVLEQKEEEHV